MGLFKQILVDRILHSKKIPDNIKLIAAANPYRLRQGVAAAQSAGLVFQHVSDEVSGIEHELELLVYRVHPLPEAIIDHVQDFGSLTPATERLYIEAILQSGLRNAGASHEADASDNRLGMGVDRNAQQSRPPQHTIGGVEEFVQVVAELLSTSQEFVREQEQERSAVSLRDISRFMKV